MVKNLYRYPIVNISELVGKTLIKVEREPRGYSDYPFFVLHTADGNSYALAHFQDCCEDVRLIDEEGKMEDLVGSPILIAEKRTDDTDDNTTPPGWADDYQRWTFYTFATQKSGHVDLRFFGSSNGYYGVDVDFLKIEKED